MAALGLFVRGQRGPKVWKQRVGWTLVLGIGGAVFYWVVYALIASNTAASPWPWPGHPSPAVGAGVALVLVIVFLYGFWLTLGLGDQP